MRGDRRPCERGDAGAHHYHGRNAHTGDTCGNHYWRQKRGCIGDLQQRTVTGGYNPEARWPEQKDYIRLFLF